MGRAAQPLCEARAKAFRQYESFAGYRTLHGIFVEQSSRLLRPGGRLALVLPTSVSDLQGYKGTRRAHDRRCIVDSPLPDLGANAFADVFQPSMVLLSTRRNNDAAGPTDGAKWHVERKDLMRWERALLERMRGAPTFSKNCFGERGYQTTPADLSQIREANPPPCQEEVYLRTGADILEGQLRPPVWCVCPSRLRGNLRPKAQWQAVDVLIRQTARYPIACLGDGKAFRNSVLAGFSDGDIPPQSLVLYLNCSLIRWFHFKSHRDARQGMPQVKVGHLRMLPKIPSLDTAGGQKLHSLSQRHGGNGLSKPMRRLVDRVVAEHFQLTDQESTEISRWSSAHLPPTPRPRNNMDRA